MPSQAGVKPRQRMCVEKLILFQLFNSFRIKLIAAAVLFVGQH